MQRLRSPFRLRPGPGSEQRRGKGRKEEQHPPNPVVDDESGTQRSSGDDNRADTAAAAGQELEHKITGASLRNRRGQVEGRGDVPDGSPDSSDGSK